VIPHIKTLPPKNLIGIHVTMSLADNKTAALWGRFMPRRKEIRQAANSVLYSLQLYPPGYFTIFRPETEFEKWAAVEVTDSTFIPPGMELLEVQGGLYAVFPYKGLPSAAAPFFQQLFSNWLPASGYEPDDRPHFELLGEKYRNNDPDSEEEIWIPVRPKTTFTLK